MLFKKNKGIALVSIGGVSPSVKPDIDNFITLFSPFVEIFLLFTEDPRINKPGIHYINIKKPLINSYLISFIGFIIYQFNLIKALYHVREINKIVDRDEVARTLLEADVLILPLKQFSGPYPRISTKLYEYQAAGRLIICCSEGMSERYVSDTKSGGYGKARRL